MFTEQQLRSYLAWAVHGRKPPRRASRPTRKGPPRDDDYKAWIRDAPVLCLRGGRTQRSRSHRVRRGHEHEAIGLFLRPFMLRLPHASAECVPPRRQVGV
jgi:hypothetical protein